jgi:HEAT repeat protein
MIVPLLGAALLQGILFDTPQTREPGDPAPDTVLVAPAGSLQERWAWAERSARDRRDAYWIGWTVPGDPSGARWYYIDRGVPVRTGASVILGTFRVSGSVGGLTFQGVPLTGVVGAGDLHETVVLLRYDRIDGRLAISRVHVGSFAFPVHFDGGVLFWLGRGDDAGSVPLLRNAYIGSGDERLGRDLVSAVAAHRSASAAMPALREWLADAAEPSGIRRIAAESLAELGGAGAADALLNAVRNDTSAAVRSAAARGLARSAEPALAVAELARAAREDADRGVRRNAVSAIGSIRHPLAFDALVEIIDEPVDTVRSDTRRTALSSVIARAGPPTPASREVLDLLERAALGDADASVRRQAISSMVSLRDARVTPTLVRIAQSHADASTRRSAVNGLADAQPRADALAALRSLAWEHESADTQRAAVNALERMEGHDVRTLLAELAESHPRADVRRAALRAVIEMDTRGGGP